MDSVFALVFGVLVAIAVYLVMSRNVLRIVLGLLVLGNAANLSIFLAGRMGSRTPPLVPEGVAALAGGANPLPQALILTAIVISFCFFTFLLVLAYRAYQELGTDGVDEMRLAEPRREPPPPLGY